MNKSLLFVFSAAALAGCGGGGSPFGGQRVSVAQPPVVAPPIPSGGRPSVAINAAPRRVQDTILARARSRGTTIVGSNSAGVTLEAPLSSSSEVVEQQCGPHRPGRTQRIYLETLPNGQGTIVSEDRFIVDGGSAVCQLSLTPADVDNGNRSLADLKQQSEAPRVASAGPGAPGQRPVDPAGGLEPLNPGRPVVPIR